MPHIVETLRSIMKLYVHMLVSLLSAHISRRLFTEFASTSSSVFDFTISSDKSKSSLAVAVVSVALNAIIGARKGVKLINEWMHHYKQNAHRRGEFLRHLH